MKLVKLPYTDSVRDTEGYKTEKGIVEINPEHISTIRERTLEEKTTKEVKVCVVHIMNESYTVTLSREELDKVLKGV